MNKPETITKEKIALHLKEYMGFSNLFCEEITNNIFSQILELVLNKNKLVLANFGKFQIFKKAKRPGVNLQTGKVVEISERKVLRFNAATSLRQKVNSHGTR